MKADRFLVLAALVVSLVATGCASTAPQIAPGEQVGFTVLTDSLPGDPEMEALIAPYREELAEQISEVIGSTPVELQKGRPEGTLGVFAAEAMLHQVQTVSEDPVHMALTNNGGLRVPIGPGPLTVGKMFELMPFENAMIVLELSGAQVDSLAQQLARGGGDPIAGFSLVIRDGRAEDVRVGGEPLADDMVYRLVTSDYLANGGGPYSVMWDPSIQREELAYFLRDAFTDYLREIGTIEPKLPGLIRIAQ